MIKLNLSFNRARCYAGVDKEGKAYGFVKVPAKTEAGINVSVNVDPTEWFAIATQFNLFDVVELPVEGVVADQNGRCDKDGVPYKRAVNPSWGEAVVIKKGFGAMPSYELLKKNADLTNQAAASTVVTAAASDDM